MRSLKKWSKRKRRLEARSRAAMKKTRRKRGYKRVREPARVKTATI